MLKSPTLPKVMFVFLFFFFCFRPARADGKCLRPYDKDKDDKISFILMNTLYHSNN